MFKYVTFEVWFDGFGFGETSCKSLAGSEAELDMDMIYAAHKLLTSSPWNFKDEDIDNADLALVVISIEPW